MIRGMSTNPSGLPTINPNEVSAVEEIENSMIVFREKKFCN